MEKLQCEVGCSSDENFRRSESDARAFPGSGGDFRKHARQSGAIATHIHLITKWFRSDGEWKPFVKKASRVLDF
jgi:hypothetical protein